MRKFDRTKQSTLTSCLIEIDQFLLHRYGLVRHDAPLFVLKNAYARGLQMSGITMRVLGGAVVGASGLNLLLRYTDRVVGADPFSEHSREQHKKHWISGMHEPYIPNASQKEFVKKHFSQFQHLIPFSQEALDKQYRLKSPVHMKYLTDCPVDASKLGPGGTVVVGGPPALISTAFERGVIYLNDGRRPPIALGSAFHLEWDAESEAPTSSQPVHFMKDQIKRVIFPEYLATAQQTGHFSWKSLDWTAWAKVFLKNPSKCLEGIRVAIAFQRFTQSGPHPEVIAEVAMRAKKNERFYTLLDKESDHQLMLPGQGSIYIARTQSEKDGLVSMQQGLTREGRAFPLLSQAEVVQEFGYLPQALAFGKKTHDRTLSPHFMSLLSNRVVQNGGRVINAHVTTVYTDDPDKGGILEYRINGSDERYFMRFKKLVMSLGAQQVIGVDNAPLFDIVSARGVSAIALIHLPKGATLPAAVVCGATNHVTKLAGPFLSHDKNVFLAKMTCGACIAPTSDSASYDGGAALGLKKSVSETLDGEVVILTVYGCNRQVSEHGQIHWLAVNKTLKAAARGLTPRGHEEDIGSSLPNKSSGIFIQYGAGGGGLTQAPSQGEVSV